jgi:hypothetical protein
MKAFTYARMKGRALLRLTRRDENRPWWSSEISQWVTAHGTIVLASEYGGSSSSGTPYYLP